MPEQELVKPKQFNDVEIHDDNSRLVRGWGTVDVIDKDGQRLPIEEFKRFMPIYMRRGGIITDNHTNKVVAKCLSYEFGINPQTNEEGVLLTVDVFNDYVYDDMVWDKIKRGIYRGFSFGGVNKLKDMVFEKGMDPQVILKGIEGFEFAFVEGPANAPSLFEEINYIAKSGIKKQTAEEESEKIKENKKSPEAQKAHKFKPAEWTHPNGHPRCLICGDEERTGGSCDGITNEEIGKTINVEKNDTVTDDKQVYSTQSESPSNLLKSDEFIKSFIKKREQILSNMEDNKKIGEETTLSLEGLAQEVSQLKQAMAQLIEMVEGRMAAPEAPVAEGLAKTDSKKEDEDKDKDKEKEKDVDKSDVAKEEVSKAGAEGTPVTLPKEPTEKIMEQKPAEGAETDEVKFVEKSIEKGMNEIKKSLNVQLDEIRKSLGVTKVSTPRAGLSEELGDVKKTEFKEPTNFKEANKIAKEIKRRQSQQII